jgi:hypothetical protein
MNTPTIPVIPDVIAGLTHQQVSAYFAELSKTAGFPIGMLAHTEGRLYTTYETFGRDYVSVQASTPAELVAKHIAKRPLTGIELAKQKLAEAQKLMEEEQAKLQIAA